MCLHVALGPFPARHSHSEFSGLHNRNIAGSGLNLGHLRLIFKRSGEDGLVDVFSMNNSLGKPRVTPDKKVLGECIPNRAHILANEFY